MMKKLAFLTLALVIATSTLAAAAVHIVGGGTPRSNDAIPFTGPNYWAVRWQTMWFQSELGETGDITRIEWLTFSSSSGGSYSNCDILLCHTGISAITTNFANNYGGKTPVTVFSGTYKLPASSASQWITIVDPTNFTYNNSDNLLIEVSRLAGTGSVYSMYVRRGSSNVPGRVYNTSSKTAPTGRVESGYHHYGRITIGYAGVAATSLGRIKGLYN